MLGSSHNRSADGRQREETQPKTGDGHKRLFTLNEAGAYIGLSHWTIRSLMYRTGELPYIRIGRRILIDLKDLDALIDSKKQKECIQRR
jgi:excisionase family DNA binding protein